MLIPIDFIKSAISFRNVAQKFSNNMQSFVHVLFQKTSHLKISVVENDEAGAGPSVSCLFRDTHFVSKWTSTSPG